MKILSSLSLVAALVLVSCDDSDSAKKAPENAELIALREKLEAINMDLESEGGDRAKLIAKYEGAIDSLESSVESLNAKLDSVKLEKPVEVVKEDPVPEVEPEISMAEIMAIRGAAVGETYEKLELGKGRVYHDVRITGVDEIGLKFTHRDGAARIDFLSLSGEWKERFHFNIARFVEAQKSERIARHNWDKSVEERLARLREDRKEEADKARIAKLELELAKAKRPVQISQVASSSSSFGSNSPFDSGYSTVLYPSYTRSWSSAYCPPVISSGRRCVSVPYRPSVGCRVGTPIVRPPVVRAPISRPPVVRSLPSAAPRYRAH